MRRTLIILFLLLPCIPLLSQYRYHYPDAFYYPSLLHAENTQLAGEEEESSWVRYSLSSGVFFNSLSGFNTVTSFISPKAFIPIGSRFAIEVGGTFITSRIPGVNSDNGMTSNSFITYARGIFSLNEKTIVYGEVAKSLFSDNPLGGKGFESYTFGMEYFVTPNFRIGASVTSVNGTDPRYLYSPFNSPLRYENPLFY